MLLTSTRATRPTLEEKSKDTSGKWWGIIVREVRNGPLLAEMTLKEVQSSTVWSMSTDGRDQLYVMAEGVFRDPHHSIDYALEKAGTTTFVSMDKYREYCRKVESLRPPLSLDHTTDDAHLEIPE